MPLEDNGDHKVKAAAVARDVTIAFAGTFHNPNQGNPDAYAECLVKIYDAIHAAALKSIK